MRRWLIVLALLLALAGLTAPAAQAGTDGFRWTEPAPAGTDGLRWTAPDGFHWT